MTQNDLARLRLHSQQLANPQMATPEQVVALMGAMQAQDPRMVHWAIGARMQATTLPVVTKALDTGAIIRTHLLRPTWHLVAAGDIYWMLELTAPNVRRQMVGVHVQRELTPELMIQSNDLIVKALEEHGQLTREALVDIFTENNIALHDNRAAHLLMWAELEGLICSGSSEKGKQTYALLEARVPHKILLSREEALATLARRYFTSHGPATVQDFVWWSGLGVADARKGLAANSEYLVSFDVNTQTYWCTQALLDEKPAEDTTHLLPAFDEFLISYRDRTATLTFENFTKAVSSNGIFRPTLVVNGETVGIWKQTPKRDKLVIEPTFFRKPDEETKSWLTAASAIYAQFLEKPVEIRFPEYFDF